jgi:ribosome-associated heat shock protein Hsp15
MNDPELDAERLRLDKWLWFARFYKSRSEATEAVEGGRVHLNGARVKPSHAVRIGDRIVITRAAESWDVEVRDLLARRGPAAAAAAAYAETAESAARREAARASRRMAGGAPPRPPKRPDKRARRALLRLQRGR